jgi:hypothetical protein
VSIAHAASTLPSASASGAKPGIASGRPGLAVRYHEDRAGHTITPGGVAHARAVLGEALA